MIIPEAVPDFFPASKGLFKLGKVDLECFKTIPKNLTALVARGQKLPVGLARFALHVQPQILILVAWEFTVT